MKDLNYYKEKLEMERAKIVAELEDIGSVPDNRSKDEWQATPGDIDTTRADCNEVADKIETFEENNDLVGKFETDLAEIDQALEHIKNKTYGICTVCGKQIEDDRLEANPEATTCEAHMNS